MSFERRRTADNLSTIINSFMVMRQMIRKRQAPKIRWTRALSKLRALTIRQPWAWLIVNGYKDIENRSWQTRHRGALLIHAGASKSDLNKNVLAAIEKRYHVRLPQDYVHSGLIGVVNIADCKKRTSSPWHRGGKELAELLGVGDTRTQKCLIPAKCPRLRHET
jgi:hypothetical protein